MKATGCLSTAGARHTSSQHDKVSRGSDLAPAKVPEGREGTTDRANGCDNAALRALVYKLPDLSYMLSDTLVVPPKNR